MLPFTAATYDTKPDRNSVSAESIGIRAEIFFSETETFFFQKISKNFMYFCFLEEYKFLKT